MKRRKFITSTAAITAAIWLDARADARFSQPKRLPDARKIIVVGAGAMGGWTALNLAQSGAEVTLVDAYGAGNSRAASGGESRLIRCYYENPLYTRMALEAYDLWQNWQARWQTLLLLPTGVAVFAEADGKAEVTRLHEGLAKAGITEAQLLPADALQLCYPLINLSGIAMGLNIPGGRAASVIRARLATQRVAQAFSALGGKLVTGQAVAVDTTPKGITVRLNNGEKLSGDVAVFACGAWMGKLFPGLIESHIKVERRDVFYFGPPAGDAGFSFPNLPAWSFINENYYGFPDVDGRGFKVAPYPDNNPIDPDNDDRRVNNYVAERAQAFLRKRFPRLAGQPLVETRVCQDAYTQSDDFIIDRHPQMENVWLMTGGSGHAFKHGPVIGLDTARRILYQGGNPEYAKAWAWPSRKPEGSKPA